MQVNARRAMEELASARRMIVELCACLNAAVRVGRRGALPDGTSVEVWAETIKRAMAQAAQDSGDDRDPAIPAPKRPGGTVTVRLEKK